MFCKYCGSAIDNDVNFCPNCGAKLSETAEPTYNAELVNQTSPVSELLEKLVKSPVYIVAMIAVAASAVFSIIPLGNLPEELTGGSGVFSILYAVAMFLIYCSVKDGKKSTAGFTVIKVASIIKIVIYSLASLLVIIVAVAFNTIGSILLGNEVILDAMAELERENINITGSLFLTLCSVVCVTALVVFIFAIIVETRIISTVNNAKNAVTDDIASSDGISTFAAVLLIISAVFSLLTLNIFAIASQICSAILIFRYKNGMIEIEK